MALATYSDVVAATQNWLFGRADIAPRVPEFVAMAEAKFNRNLLCRQMEKRATTPLDPTSAEPEFVALPGDFQTMRRIRLINTFSPGPVPTTKPRLKFATGAQMDELRERTPNLGAPVWFSLLGDELELLPTPDQAYKIEMVYRAYLPPLGAVNATNWLLTLAPDAYLYGTLMEVAPYLHEDERIAVWSAGLSGAIADLNKLSDESTYNAGPITARRTRRHY